MGLVFKGERAHICIRPSEYDVFYDELQSVWILRVISSSSKFTSSSTRLIGIKHCPFCGVDLNEELVSEAQLLPEVCEVV